MFLFRRRPPREATAPRGRFSPQAFFPGSAALLDGGVCSILVSLAVIGGPPRQRERVRFYASRVLLPWRCAVTGRTIPAGAVALTPAEGDDAAAVAFAESVRVSLDGWQLLAKPVRAAAPRRSPATGQRRPRRRAASPRLRGARLNVEP